MNIIIQLYLLTANSFADYGEGRDHFLAHHLVSIVVVIVIIFIFLLLWNLVLKRIVSARTALLLEERQKLQDNILLLRSYMENLPHGIFVSDKRGKYLDVNPAAAVMTGYSREELLKMGISDLMVGQGDSAHFEALRFSGRIEVEKEFRRKNGTIGFWRLEAVKISDDYFLGFTTDLTEKRVTETRLRETEENYRMVFDEMTDGFAIHEMFYDRNGKPTDYKFLDVNPAFTTHTGLTRQQVVGRAVKDILPGTEEYWIQTYGEIAKSGGSKRIENFASELDKYFEVTVFQTRPNFFACIFQDITIRKRMEKSLREERDFFLAVTDTSPVGISILNSKGEITFTNDRAQEIFDLSSETIGERKYDSNDWKITDYDGNPFATEKLPFARVMNEKRSVWDICHAIESPSGRRVLLSINASPIFDDNKNIRSVICTIEDVTKSKTLESTHRQNEKMQAIGQLAGGVAHDFNNQLAAIMGNAKILHQKLDDPDLQKYLDRIIRGAKNSADLTSKLLSFARKGSFRSIGVDIHRIIDEVSTILEHSIDRRIRVVSNLKAGSKNIMGDPSQVENMILNLALNGRDAMEGEGELRFESSNVVLQQSSCDICGDLYKSGEYILIKVIDSGSGIPEANISKVFEPFFTTKAEGEGTGMGLAAVFGTVKMLNGHVHIDSKPGHGTTVSLYIPVTLQTEAPADKNLPVLNKVNCEQTVLLVEDEESLREVVGEMLCRAGFKVIEAIDGEQAVNIYRDKYKLIDFVLIDLVMPKKNGKEAFTEMKAINSDICAILLSGFGMEGEVQSVMDLGVQEFLQKPYQEEDLLGKISRLMAQRTF